MLKVQTPNGEDKVLLHSCCAPCSSAIIECMLENGIRPTVFYCNPNIYPQAEYEIRKEEAIRFVTSKNLDFIDADYDYAHWLHTIKRTGKRAGTWQPMPKVLHTAPDRDSPLRLRAWFLRIHHYPRLFALEKPGANQ